jgi:hypothetical protein
MVVTNHKGLKMYYRAGGVVQVVELPNKCKPKFKPQDFQRKSIPMTINLIILLRAYYNLVTRWMKN